MRNEFVGVGLGFPMRPDATGRIGLVSDEVEIEQAIVMILGTAYGERPMRPEFGCGLHDYVFAPADATTAGRLAFEIRGSLTRWEPRIDVTNVDVLVDPTDRNLLHIEIGYRIRSTNSRRNLVFPFYTIPGERTP